MEALWAVSPTGGTRDDTNHHEKVPEHMQMFYGDGQELGGIPIEASANKNNTNLSYTQGDAEHRNDNQDAPMSTAVGDENGADGGVAMMETGGMNEALVH